MEFISKNPENTIVLAEKLGKYLKKGMVLCLNGDLAGGKTTFTKGIAKALKINETINSPTFTILKIYEGDLMLYHIDAYRLANNPYDLGIDEYISDGVMVIEWPEFFKDYLPEEYLDIYFTFIDDNTRSISFMPHGSIYDELLKELKNEDTMS